LVSRYLSSSGLSHKQTVGSPLRSVGSTLSPSCRLYEPEAGLEALRAASGSYRHDPTPRREAETESWSQTPVVSCPLAISQTELLLSDTLHRVSFHLRQSKAYPTDHNYTPACHRLSFHVLYGSWLLAMAGRYFGAQYRACGTSRHLRGILAFPGFRLLLRGLPAGSATDPARLSSEFRNSETSESVAGRLLARL